LGGSGGGVRGGGSALPRLAPQPHTPSPKHDIEIQAEGAAGLAQTVPEGSRESARHAGRPQ